MCSNLWAFHLLNVYYPLAFTLFALERQKFQLGISSKKRIPRFLIIFINPLRISPLFLPSAPKSAKWNCKILVLLKNPLKCKISCYAIVFERAQMKPFALPFNTEIALPFSSHFVCLYQNHWLSYSNRFFVWILMELLKLISSEIKIAGGIIKDFGLKVKSFNRTFVNYGMEKIRFLTPPSVAIFARFFTWQNHTMKQISGTP